MFGYSLVKTSILTELVNVSTEALDHVEANGGFLNEKRTFASDGNNKAIQAHWNLFHTLTRRFFSLKYKLLK
jgi:hypothetical protein